MYELCFPPFLYSICLWQTLFMYICVQVLSISNQETPAAVNPVLNSSEATWKESILDLQNIPVPSPKVYHQMMINSCEHLLIDYLHLSGQLICEC